MNLGQSLFAQLMDHLPTHEFRRCVQRYGGNYRVRSFSCWDQFLCMAFAQLTFRESLRDIVACLRSQERRLYHLGIRGTVSRSTLADANESRDWRIYADFAAVLIAEARQLYGRDDLGLGLASAVYALDSTIIDLCMTLFPWARYKSAQHALKLHTLLDLRGSIPTFIRVTAAQVHDVNLLDALTPEAGAFYVMDRAYLDFERLYRWTEHGAFFVTRARKDFRFTRLFSHPVDKTTGVQCDQTIALVWFYPARGYPARLRRIRYWDAEHERRLVFLTNNFVLPAPRDRRSVSPALASRAVFQVDQTKSPRQGLLWNLGERGEDTNLDRRLQLSAGGHRAQAAQSGPEAFHHAADLERVAVRENTHPASLFARWRATCGD